MTVTATPSSVLASPSIAISSDVIPESVITPAPEAPSSQPTSAAHYTNATSEVDSTTTISTFITTYLGTGTGAAYPTGY